MIYFLNTSYPGAVVKKTNDIIAVCINTATTNYGQIVGIIKDVTEFSETEEDGTIKERYVVSGPKMSSLIAENLIYIEFAVKPPLVKQLESTIADLSDAVDELLVAILEG